MSGGPGRGIQRTTDGNLVDSGSYILHAMTIEAGPGATGIVDLKEGGSGGTIIWSLSAVQGSSESVDWPNGMAVKELHVDVTGAAASVSVELV